MTDIFKTHPHFQLVSQVYYKILGAGHEVLLAGGCVRDGVLGVLPKDFDLATSATPEQIVLLFEKTVDIGKAFGVVMVIEQGVQVEVTTFRQDGAYEDGRRPTSVHFSSAEEDAKRRDFTVNALFFDLKHEKLIDFVGGMKDLNQHCLRAVGDAGLRFQEDALRMLRAVRFVGQLGFSIEQATRLAISEDAERVLLVSRERIHTELEKLLLSRHGVQGLQEWVGTGLAKVLFPKAQFSFGLLSSWFVSETLPLTAVQAWISFWNAYWDASLEKNEQAVFEVMDSLRFSSAQKSSIHQALRFRFQTDRFSSLSLGQLIELCFEPDLKWALQVYASKGLIDEKKWRQIKQLHDGCGPNKPAALIRAQDLQGQIAPGPSLGLALKLCYWAQLEGRVQSMADAVNELKRQKILQ